MSSQEELAHVEEVLDHVAERANRLAKLEAFKQAGIHPYPERFEKSIDLSQAKELSENEAVKTAGRIMLFRQMGSITFAHLRIFQGACRLSLRKIPWALIYIS